MILAILSLTAPAAFAAVGDLAILQGMTTATSTQMMALVGIKQQVEYQLLPAGTGPVRSIPAHGVRRITHGDSEWAVDRFGFEGLESGRRYLLRAVSAGQVLDERELGTLDLERDSVRIGLISCTSRLRMKIQDSMWKSVSDAKADLLFFMGDNVYASILSPVTPDEMWFQYVQAWQKYRFYHERKLTPVLATWDDHDFGQNDGDSVSYKYAAEAREMFNAYFPQEEVGGALERGPGVSSLFRAFGQRFFLMDDRYFRVDGKTMWGAEQEKWLNDRIGADASPAWILNGNQIFGRYNKGEAYEKKFEPSFVPFVELIRSIRAPVLFVSGDVHYSEILKLPADILGYTAYEITSSSLFSVRKPWGGLPDNPRRERGVFNDNFILAEVSGTHSASPKLHLTSYGQPGQKFFEYDLTLSR